MRMKNKVHIVIWLVLGVMLTSCGGPSSKNEKTADKTQDTLHIWVDTSLALFMKEHKKAFENTYNEPSIQLQFYDEALIVDGLLKNKVSCAVLHRNLNEKEAGHLKVKEDFPPKQYTFAKDAYACIVSSSSAVDKLALSDLEAYFSGKGALSGRIAVENSHAQAVQFIKNRFSLSNEQVSRLYAKNNVQELLEYLRTDPSTIGIIPFSYISDPESESTAAMMKGLRVLPVVYTDSIGKTQAIKPSQQSIATRQYPLISPVVFVNCNMEKKSGTNFVNYLFKPRGQRLVLKFGLCPAIFPGREVNIHTD